MHRLGVDGDPHGPERRADSAAMRKAMAVLIERVEKMERSHSEMERSHGELKSDIAAIVQAMHVALGVNLRDPESIADKAAEVALIQRAGRVGMAIFTAFCVAIGIGVITLVAKSDLLH